MLKAGTKRRRTRKEVQKARETQAKIQKLGQEALAAQLPQVREAPGQQRASTFQKEGNK